MGDIHGSIVDLTVGNEHLSEQNNTRKLIIKHQEKINKVLLDGLHDAKKTFEICKKKKT